MAMFFEILNNIVNSPMMTYCINNLKTNVLPWISDHPLETLALFVFITLVMPYISLTMRMDYKSLTHSSKRI